MRTATSLLLLGASLAPFISIDFTRGIDPRLTFTRASSATYYDNAGILRTAASNIPRLDYDPATLQPKGLLVEEQRTNQVLQSNTFNVTWTPNGTVTPTAAGITTPDGNSGAWKIIENTANANHDVFSQVSRTSGQVVTSSVVLKAGSRTWAVVANYDGITAWGAFFDLANGVVGGNGALIAPTAKGMQNLGNGWWRCWITSTMGNTALGNIFISTATGDGVRNYLGNSSFVYAYGAQDEVGLFMTSPIVTTTATVTRAQDNASIGATVLNAPLNAGAVAVKAQLLGVKNMNFFQFNPSLGNDFNGFSAYINGTNYSVIHKFNGSVVFATSFAGVNTNLATMIISQGGIAANASVNGTLFGGISGSSAINNGSALALFIGNGADGGPFSGWIQTVKYWKRALSRAEVQVYSK